jgi:uncharacterized protein
VLPTGHRVGVLVTSSNSEWWTHVPTFQTVTVNNGSITLPFLRCQRNATIQGDPSLKLEDYRASDGGAAFPVSAATVSGATDPGFPVPPPLSAC